MASVWPRRPADDPYANVINARRKHVASRTLTGPLEWNATLLEGDVAESVAALRERTDLAILGSGQLIRALMPHGLIDEWLLIIHPLVLGTGLRMFPDGGVPAALRLVDTLTTTTGVIVATYRAA
jgi:dihydrofolate reductase